MSCPCHVPAVLQPYRFANNFSRPRHSMAGARHCICELTSAIARRPIGDLHRFVLFRLSRGVLRVAFRIFQATREISRRVRHCRSTEGIQHGTAGARLCMCEIALKETISEHPVLPHSYSPIFIPTVYKVVQI
jgi:hypothetical protein